MNLWLSRHLFFRLICTGNTSPSFLSSSKLSSQSHPWKNRSIGQVLRKYCSSGQYFDAPSRSAILSACSGGDHHHGNNHHTHAVLSSNFANSFLYRYIVLPLFRAYNWILSLKQNSDLTMFQFKNGKNKKRNHNKGGGDTYLDSSNSNHQSLTRKQRLKTSQANSNGNNRMVHNQQKLLSSKAYKKLEKIWENLPPSQLFFAIVSGLLCVALIVTFHPNTYNLNSHTSAAITNPNSNYFFAQTSFNRGNMYHRHHQNSHTFQQNGNQNKKMSINLNQPPHPDSNLNVAPYFMDYIGQKQFSFWDPFNLHSTNPGIVPLFLFIAACGTLSSLVLYGRVILPIPDLTTGGNIMENIQLLTNKVVQTNSQQRSRSRHNSSSGGGILSSMNLTSNSKNSNLSSSSSNKKVDKDAPWAETYKSIQHENRLVMLCKIILLRTLENIFVCVMLPQSFVVCKITNHCNSYPLLWERAASFALDPWRIVGLHGIGADASITTAFESIQVDPLVKFCVIASVILTTVAILLAQAITLDKGFLSSMGYVSGELMYANDSVYKFSEIGISNVGGVAASNNVNRRHKKGNGNNYNHKNSTSSNSSTGSNSSNSNASDMDMEEFNIFLRVAHFLFQYDQGHPTTSSVISVISMIQFFFIVLLLNVYLYYDSMGYESNALALMIASSIMAGYATCCIGAMDYNELQRISFELSGIPKLI